MQAVLTAAAAFARFARPEIEALLPPGAALEELAPGVWLLCAPGRLGDLARQLWATVFVRHACPADHEFGLEAGPAALALAVAEAMARRVTSGCQVQVRLLPGAPAWPPAALVQELRQDLGGLGVITTGGPSPFVLALTVAAERAWAGFGPVSDNLSPWPGGIARLRPAPDEVSRSARKLEEAVQLFGLHVAAGTRALDLGAAPGGWTSWLLGRGASVTAVDTGLLAPALRGRAGLTVLRGSVLRVPPPAGPFDLLCADLSWDPLRAADGALRFLPGLSAEAHGVFTVKFFGQDPLLTVERVRRHLQAQGLEVVAVRQLYHNRAEATAHLRRGGASVPSRRSSPARRNAMEREDP